MPNILNPVKMRRGDDVLLEEGGCFFDGASSILSTDSDAGDVSEVDNDDFDEASSVSSIGSDASKNMAAQLQLKYLSPPVFRAERDDDAFDGLNRYETTEENLIISGTMLSSANILECI